MTEAEWLACSDPEKMLEFLRTKMTNRKLRLLACACVRRVWVRSGEPTTPVGVEVSERFSDGAASEKDLRAVRVARRPNTKASIFCRAMANSFAS